MVNTYANSLLWTNTDTKYTALASVVPVGLGLGYYLSSRPGGAYYHVWEGSSKPSYLQSIPSQLLGVLDAASFAPLGYASYLIYRNGGGFDYTDTTVALGLYGANLIFAAANLVLYENRNLKGLAINKTIVFLTSLATGYAFYNIDENAGLWYGIYAAVSAACALNYCKLACMNSPPKND